MTEVQADPPSNKSDHTRALSRLTFAGIAAIALLVGTLGVWSATAPISGAVIATGRLVVTDNRKQVQHPTGGVVGAIYVREGAMVEEGAVVLELDATETQAQLAVIEKKLDELRARSARLLAEQNDAEAPIFPVALTDRAGIYHVAETLATERALFEARKRAVTQRKNQLQEQIGQLEDEIQGRLGIQTAKKRHAEITRNELEALESLKSVKLVRLDRLNAIQRDAARIEAEIAENDASIARAKGRISEIRVQMMSVEDDMRAEIIKELRETQAEISRLEEQRITSEMELKRVQIRSPIAGQVLQLNVHTIGGVIKPAEPLMEIVPLDAELEVEAPVAPQDIDQIYIGQTAEIKLLALNQNTLPQLSGIVTLIPSDTVKDERTGATFYNVRLHLTEESRNALKHVKLVAGMQADVFATTTPRTFASYIARPIVAQMERAFREQ